jgi:hypothetical protein
MTIGLLQYRVGSMVVSNLPVVTPANFNLALPTTNGFLVGIVSASNSPTSWSITAGNSSGYFAISNSGNVTVTATGASGLTAGTYSLTVQATNAFGSGTGTVGINASSGYYILPAVRAYSWQPGVTYNGGIPVRNTIYTTLSPSGGDDTSALQTALTNCPAGSVVLLNSGIFNVSGGTPLFINKGITLRGAGAGVTIITKTDGAAPRTTTVANYCTDGTVFAPNAACDNTPVNYSASDVPLLIVGNNQYGNHTYTTNSLTVDAAQGATTLTLANTTGLAVNQFILIDELSGASYQTGYSTSGQVWAGDRITYNMHNPQASGDDNTGGSTPVPYVTGVQPNGVYDYAPAVTGGYAPGVTVWFSRYDRATCEIRQITAIAGNVVTISKPLSISFRVSHTAQVMPFVGNNAFVSNVGIENLTLSRGAGGDFFGGCLLFNWTAYCWAKAIEVTLWKGHGVAFNASYLCELRDSYIHTGACPTNAGNGYAITFQMGSSDCLVENCISIDTCKVMLGRAAGGGNVAAYNYMDNVFGAVSNDSTGYENFQEVGLSASHFCGPHHFLYEGNYACNFDEDFTHGNTGYATVLRNVLTGVRRSFADTVSGGYGGMRCAGLMAYSINHSFVGNILGKSGTTTSANGWVYTDPSMGCDVNGSNCVSNTSSGFSNTDIWKIGWDNRWNGSEPTALSTMIRDGNYDYLTNSQRWHNTPSAPSIPNSWYLTTAPAFFGSNPWPWVNPSNGVQNTLPAKVRYDSGNPNGVTNPPSTGILVAGQAGPNIGINFNSATDAGQLVGAIAVTTAGGAYVGTITIGGTNGSSFSLSATSNVSSASYPCNLYVSQSNLPAGTYTITITANP